MPDQPLLLVIGGPNGAGKTTFAREYLTREMKGLRFLNTDEIARGLSPFDVDSVAFKAGRIFLEEVKEEISAKEESCDRVDSEWTGACEVIEGSKRSGISGANTLSMDSFCRLFTETSDSSF